MEKRVNNKARTYFQTFKDDIKNTILKSELMNDAPLTTAEIRQEMSSLLQYIYDYQPITFEKIDFQKVLTKKTLDRGVRFAYGSCFDQRFYYDHYKIFKNIAGQ